MKINKLYHGDCLSVLKTFPDNTFDIIFADPPYNLQLNGDLKRPDQSSVLGVNDNWDKFESYKTYDNFTFQWLTECRRVLKKNGAIWVIGSYHNIFRVGSALQDLGYWILNDIIWRKTNPMPNFKGTRFTNAHETIIWAAKDKNSRYTFNYDAMKSLNDEKQMRSDWLLPICTGKERLKINGKKVHPTQKPLSLITRIILSSSNENDLVLDPFSGSGSTAVVAKLYSRNWVGIEKEEKYVLEAEKRINSVKAFNKKDIKITLSKKSEPRVPFGYLLESGILNPGEILFDGRNRWFAKVRADGSLITDRFKGSIHKVGACVQGLPACNGWTFWHTNFKGSIVSIDTLRNIVRNEHIQFNKA